MLSEQSPFETVPVYLGVGDRVLYHMDAAGRMEAGWLICALSNQRRGTDLAVSPIEEVAHGFSASSIEIGIGLRFLATALLGRGLRIVLSAAIRTTIGKTRLVGFQLELFRANAANFDRKGHAILVNDN